VKQSWWKIAVVLALAVAVAAVVAMKNKAPATDNITANDTGLTAPLGDGATESSSEARMDEGSPHSSPADESTTSGSKNAAEEPVEKSQAKASEKSSASEAKAETPKTAPAVNPSPKPASNSVQSSRQLPKLLDLGAKKCVPCKMMAPILDELTEEYKGRLTVVFIDVWENRGEAEKYGIQSIPTQIFYDEKGEEFFRHVGFFSKEDILKTFADRGVKLTK